MKNMKKVLVIAAIIWLVSFIYGMSLCVFMTKYAPSICAATVIISILITFIAANNAENYEEIAGCLMMVLFGTFLAVGIYGAVMIGLQYLLIVAAVIFFMVVAIKILLL